MIASMADEIVETIEQKLARYESVIGLQMEEITRLRAVVAKLTEGADDAHSTLRRLYLDETQPSNTRLKAAAASLNFERPRLESVPPPLELTPEPIEPLADVVSRQRARADLLMQQPPYRVLPVPSQGNGASDDDSGDQSS
jgi:hypothetical protein